MGGRVLFVVSVFLSVVFTSESHADGAALAKLFAGGIGDAVKGAFCHPDSASQKLLKSIDGFSISGGITLKGHFGAHCEATFWKVPTTTARMATQNFCYPSVGTTTGGRLAVNAAVSVIYGCNGDPENYKGYFAGAGVRVGNTTAVHHWGVGDGFFEDAAVFLGLADRPKNADGQNFDEMIAQFQKAKGEIQGQLKELSKNPAAALALKGFQGKVNSADKGEMESTAMIADLISKQKDFLAGIDDLLPRMVALRENIGVVSKMSSGQSKEDAKAHIAAEAAMVTKLLTDVRLEASPSVIPFFTTSRLDGTIPKKGVFNSSHPPATEEEMKEILWNITLPSQNPMQKLSLNPIRFPQLKGFIVDKDGKRQGSDWIVPKDGFGSHGMGGKSIQVFSKDAGKLFNGPDSLKDPGKLPEGFTLVKMDDYNKALDSYQKVVTNSLDAIEAARGFFFFNDHNRAAAKFGGKLDPDRKVGAIQKSDYLSGCNAISIPLERFAQSIVSAIPSKNTVALSGGLSHYYQVGGRGEINTPPGIKSVLKALNACVEGGPKEGPPHAAGKLDFGKLHDPGFKGGKFVDAPKIRIDESPLKQLDTGKNNLYDNYGNWKGAGLPPTKLPPLYDPPKVYAPLYQPKRKLDYGPIKGGSTRTRPKGSSITTRSRSPS